MTNTTRGLTPEIQQAISRVMGRLTVAAREDPCGIERLADLFEQEPGERMVSRWLADAMPAEVDSEQWLAWLEGISAPPAAHPLPRVAKSGSPSARGGHASAVKQRDGAKRQKAIAQAALVEAEEALEAAEALVKETDAHLRQVIAGRLDAEWTRKAAGVFAMGPAWVIMRSVSAYIRIEPGFLDTLDPEQRARAEALITTSKADSVEMLDLLDLYAGDTLLELRLRWSILSALRRHHEPVEKELAARGTAGTRLSRAAKRLRRKAEDRNASVRPDAPVADRHDVLRGLIHDAAPRDANEED